MVNRAGKILGVMLWLGAAAFAAVCHAAPFHNEYFALELPAGYQGPQSQQMGQAVTYAFTKPHLGGSTASLYQVSVFDAGEGARRAGEESAPKDAYLQQFLDGVRARRTEWSVTPFADATVGNRPARTASWSGRMEGRLMAGQMYVAVAGSRVYVIHIQDFDEYTERSMPVLRQMVAGITLFRDATTASAAAPKSTAPVRKKITPAQLQEVVGGRVRITLKDGRVREGLINAVEGETAILSVDGTSGGMTFPIPFSTMLDVELRQ